MDKQLHSEWTAANHKVREAEDRLAAAWAAFASGKAAPPPKELLTDVSRLRREADERLGTLLDQLHKDGLQANDGPDSGPRR